MLTFHTLSRGQAQSYLAVFVSEMPASVQRLAQALEDTGEDPALAEDLTPGSLDRVWRAVAPRLAWQDLFVPANPPERWSPEAPLEGLGDLALLPSWFTTSTGYGLEHFSPSTLWVMDGVARHLGNVLLHSESWEWRVGRGPRGYAFQNQPVVAGPVNEFSPLMTTAVIVGRHLKGTEPDGDAVLSQTYRNWVNPPPMA